MSHAHGGSRNSHAHHSAHSSAHHPSVHYHATSIAGIPMKSNYAPSRRTNFNSAVSKYLGSRHAQRAAAAAAAQNGQNGEYGHYHHYGTGRKTSSAYVPTEDLCEFQVRLKQF